MGQRVLSLLGVIAGVTITVLGISASALTFVDFGPIGVLLLAIVVVAAVVGAVSLWPVLATGPRGVRLLTSIKKYGLVDIEMRHAEHILPPVEFYRCAKHELVVICGSCFNAFWEGDKLIHELVNRQVDVFVIMMSPESPDAHMFTSINKDYRSEILKAIEYVIDRGLNTERVHVRFVDSMPPYRAMMIDGDILGNPNRPIRDSDGQIRINPLCANPVNARTVVQFRKVPSGASSIDIAPFDHFAGDIRSLWKAAKSRPDLLPPTNAA